MEQAQDTEVETVVQQLSELPQQPADPNGESLFLTRLDGLTRDLQSAQEQFDNELAGFVYGTERIKPIADLVPSGDLCEKAIARIDELISSLETLKGDLEEQDGFRADHEEETQEAASEGKFPTTSRAAGRDGCRDQSGGA